jgi:hypothetical protein
MAKVPSHLQYQACASSDVVVKGKVVASICYSAVASGYVIRVPGQHVSVVRLAVYPSRQAAHAAAVQQYA